MEDISFEQAITRLEEIVDIMNRSTTPLDIAVQLYEEAESLMRVCTSRIQQAEERIRKLSEKRKEDLQYLGEHSLLH